MPDAGRVVILRGDAACLPLPDESVDLIVTSPPYWSLRLYSDGGEHYAGQIGGEPTPRGYIDSLLGCTREWTRVLKPGGSLFVNLGDKYSTTGNPGTKPSLAGVGRAYKVPSRGRHGVGRAGIPAKSLMGLPWRYALGCMDDLGLILRAEIVWSKPNGLPESVTDRVRRSHEQIFGFGGSIWDRCGGLLRPHLAVGWRSVLAPTRGFLGAQWWQALPAGQGRTSSLRCGRSTLTCGSSPARPAPVEETGTAGPPSLSSAGGAESSRHRRCPIRGGAAASRHGGANSRRRNQIFHFTRSPRYFSAVDEVREPHKPQSLARAGRRYLAGDSFSPGTPNTLDPAKFCNPLGKLPGSVWEIATQPLRVPESLGVDHFAAYPMELVRRIVLGWSPAGICTDCRQGRRPVTAAQRTIDGVAADGLGGWRRGRDGDAAGIGNFRFGTERSIVGYACACPDDSAPTRPATVLDPLGGTGTTAAVAAAYGRTGITVDRSADYCRLARWRTSDPGQRARALRQPKPRDPPQDGGALFGTGAVS